MKTIFLALTLAAPASVFAVTPCGVVTRAEASQILGVAAGSKASPKSAAVDSSRCVIKSAKGGHDTLKIELRTSSAEDSEHMRAHTDEERGEEVQSLHDEAWYEVSAVDAAHPNDRRLVIHRDRSVLTLDVHSTHQVNVQTAFENVWAKIADRLPVQK
jgi:hypothetical protein